MSISPIDEGRYGSPEMRAVFTREAHYRYFLKVEAALVKVLAEMGDIPREAADAVAACYKNYAIPVEQIAALEKETHHELAAVIQVFAAACGSSGKYVHFGATSSDILDTAQALQFKDADQILLNRLNALIRVLSELAQKHKDTIMIGRTHGQAALPITLGFKIANWIDELVRSRERLITADKQVVVGKLSGAVGTNAGFGSQGQEIEKRVMAELGITAGLISTQVVHRDRLAEYICVSAILAGTLDAMATEVRNLQRSEIAEIFEPFDFDTQVGSSTMPHKRNPVLCENICSLARLIRGLVTPALENMVLWHERDLTNSGNERFTIHQACILLDEMLLKAIRIFGNLEVSRDTMQARVTVVQRKFMAESVMLELIRKGISRTEAYGFLRSAAHTEEAADFAEYLGRSQLVKGNISPERLNELLDPAGYLGSYTAKIDAVIRSASRGTL